MSHPLCLVLCACHRLFLTHSVSPSCAHKAPSLHYTVLAPPRSGLRLDSFPFSCIVHCSLGCIYGPLNLISLDLQVEFQEQDLVHVLPDAEVCRMPVLNALCVACVYALLQCHESSMSAESLLIIEAHVAEAC